MAKINVTLRDDVLGELDELVSESAQGSRSAYLATLIREEHKHRRRGAEASQPVCTAAVGRAPQPEPRGGAFGKDAQAGKAKR